MCLCVSKLHICINIDEAYYYAAYYMSQWTEEDRNLQRPRIDDNGDGIGHGLTADGTIEVGYDPTNQNEDGYVAAHTYL